MVGDIASGLHTAFLAALMCRTYWLVMYSWWCYWRLMSSRKKGVVFEVVLVADFARNSVDCWV